MNKDILLLVTSISNQRDVPEEDIFQAVEAALASVAARRFGENASMRVAIDRKSGDYETFRCWHVAADDDEAFDPERNISLSKAHETDPELEIGDVIEEAVESEESGRIEAQHAKQVIQQKVREAERAKIARQYLHRVGQLLNGAVKKVTRDSITLDMGANAEGILLREEMIPREAFRVNDRVRAYLYEVRDDRRGPQLLLSRTRPQMLVELFKIEVPEIGEEVIEIKAAARDPGSRAKIAVKTNDGRIDPIGACVGMRGSRVQAVSSELGGERIDIVLWDDNPAQLVINAMAPAEVSSIVVDEESHSMDISVDEAQLSQAIGRSGQNIRLASELTGWNLNVMSEADMSKKHENESLVHKQEFMAKLGVDEDIAEVLVSEGFTTLEEIAYVPKEELHAIEEFDDEIADELQRRASDFLLTQEIASQEGKQEAAPEASLLALAGMTPELVQQLAKQGVTTQEDLAEFAVDELVEILGIGEELAAKLIMEARAPWFAE